MFHGSGAAMMTATERAPGACRTDSSDALKRHLTELQCLLINLTNAINRLHYGTASRLAATVRQTIAAAEERVSKLPADVERAAQAARLSAMVCVAQRVLLVAPRAPPSDAFQYARSRAERLWMQQRTLSGPISLAYDQRTLICIASRADSSRESIERKDDVETSLVASSRGSGDRDHSLAVASAYLQFGCPG